MKTTAKRITVGAAALSLFLFADLSAGIADTTVQPSPLQQMARGLNPANWRMPQWKLPERVKQARDLPWWQKRFVTWP